MGMRESGSSELCVPSVRTVCCSLEILFNVLFQVHSTYGGYTLFCEGMSLTFRWSLELRSEPWSLCPSEREGGPWIIETPALRLSSRSFQFILSTLPSSQTREKNNSATTVCFFLKSRNSSITMVVIGKKSQDYGLTNNASWEWCGDSSFIRHAKSCSPTLTPGLPFRCW